MKALVVLATAVLASPAVAQTAQEAADMRIRIILDGSEIAATLEDNPAARDFAAMLPLDLRLTDYAGTEKISDLPQRLSVDGMPEGVDPEVGDITYYAPWGNLALFYRDFRYSRGLVRLGRIEGSMDRLAQDGAIDVRIERVDAAQ